MRAKQWTTYVMVNFSSMREATVTRFYFDSKETLGTLTSTNENKSFVCKVLELAWLNNQSNVSCVPEGRYLCKYTRSNRMSNAAGHDVFTYEVMDVPNRAGIRVHSANFAPQLLGCLALGDAHKDINSDQELDVVHSGNTIAAFVEFMNKEDFLLTIKRA